MSNEYPGHTPGGAADGSEGHRHTATKVATIIAVTMVLLAMVGAAITLADATWARRYWLLLVPIYGLLCTFAAWYHARKLDRMVTRQILHWISVGIAIVVDFTFLEGSGEQTAPATGLNALLILSLGCLLAGVHLEWMFALVGLVLLVIVVVVSIAQEYLLLVFIVGALIVALMFAAQWATKKWLG